MKFIFIFALCISVLAYIFYFNIQESNFEYVAHAGGGVDGYTYTNSIEALEYNYNKGRRIFELDFLITSDQKIVCAHEWTDYTGISKQPSESEYKAIQFFKKYPACTSDSLKKWIEHKKDAYIVVDTKEIDTERFYNLFTTEFISYMDNIIPQAYSAAEIRQLSNRGYEKIIWTLYKDKSTDEKILRRLDMYPNLFAVTMPKEKLVKSNLAYKIYLKGVRVYVHGFASKEDWLQYVFAYPFFIGTYIKNP